MTYQVVIDKPALKALSKIPAPFFDRLTKAISSLGEDPRPNGCKKLKGRSGYRIRVGDYRVIYQINDSIVTVYILSIGDRKDIYD